MLLGYLRNIRKNSPVSNSRSSSCHTGDGNNKNKSGWLISIVLIVSIIATVAVCLFVPCQYKSVIEKSKVTVVANLEGIELSDEHPEWFSLRSNQISTNRALSRTDLMELKSLVDDNSPKYKQYLYSISELAYDSNNDTRNINSLFWLTFFFVFLGCSVRTFFDFIGRYCYLKDLDMRIWWPWYCLRPVICAPVTAILIVSIRTSFFSNLFVAKDLNTYLVISFLAGFAVMEFTRMLRHISKSIFYVDEKSPGKDS